MSLFLLTPNGAESLHLVTSVWCVNEPIKPPVCLLSVEWLDLSSAVTRTRKMRNGNKTDAVPLPRWCLSRSQFLDLMDTIDKQREEIARSDKWVVFLNAFCSLVPESGPLHFLAEVTDLFSFPFLCLPPLHAGCVQHESASCRKHWMSSTLLWIHWKPSMKEENLCLPTVLCCLGSAGQSC